MQVSNTEHRLPTKHQALCLWGMLQAEMQHAVTCCYGVTIYNVVQRHTESNHPQTVGRGTCHAARSRQCRTAQPAALSLPAVPMVQPINTFNIPLCLAAVVHSMSLYHRSDMRSLWCPCTHYPILAGGKPCCAVKHSSNA